MKDVKRSEVERFLRTIGYTIERETGPHTWWARDGSRAVPLPRHRKISPGVLRSIEKIVGHVPDIWNEQRNGPHNIQTQHLPPGFMVDHRCPRHRLPHPGTLTCRS
ncbi:type II toxin-antitoxin system HicA family toxin [Paramicrobacterium humi]|uniref:type II toxin-antitoxin system HicA family toxin n=1 Tax=Paramicrobacterium humi TaxID=640635 RepID=UPI000B81BE61|nr:type II toxin-antitoxin system HicA family toxin [Microbacterium humi]